MMKKNTPKISLVQTLKNTINSLGVQLLKETIDEELVRKNIDFMSLGQANTFLYKKRLITKKEKEQGYLKNLLESGKYKYAQQTETEPRQWRVLLSDKRLKRKKVVKKPLRKRTKPKQKHHSTSNKFNWWSIIIIIGILILGYYMTENEQGNNSSTYITNQGYYYGATSKETLKNFIRYSINEEYGLANRLIQSGKVFEVPSGKEVVLIKSNFGTVKIRFKGESFEFWTVIEAISK